MTQLSFDFDREGAMAGSDDTACVLVQELERVVRRGGRGRKILVARTRGEGKELLRQVALRGASWVGFEVTAVRPLAARIAVPALAGAGRMTMDAFDEHALLEQAIDEALALPQFAEFGELAEKVGFRRAVRQAVSAIRSAGIDLANQRPGSDPDGVYHKRDLVIEVVTGYERLFAEGRLADAAGVLKAATRVLRTNGRGRVLAGARVFLLPGLVARGVEGWFLDELRRLGAVVLRTDAVKGLAANKEMPPPKDMLWKAATASGPRHDRIELFTAASISDELRGVLRRALDMGARWDEVEIIAADPWSYGSALHALAESLGVPVTFAVGLPVERTRPGRVVSGYFRWIASGFQESVVRALIEAGDVISPRRRHRYRGPRLARALRRLRIGWGRERYLDRIERALADLESMPRRGYEDAEQLEKRKQRTREELDALRALFRPVLEATPRTDQRVSPAQVAAGATSLLKWVAPGTKADDIAQERLLRQLERIKATVTREADFASAEAIVRSFLEIRIPMPRTEGTAPWSSAPGHVYMTDLRHGGCTGRPYTFIVGMDSGSLLGSLHEDPLMGDDERVRLGAGALPLAANRASDARFNFAQLFARLRGTVVLSYACWDPSECRTLTPAPELLEALRLREGDDTLNFEDLAMRLGVAESRLPRPEIPTDLDAGDVWLRALAAPNGRLRDGLGAVGRSFPRLGLGLDLAKAVAGRRASTYVGLIGTRDLPSPYQDISRTAFSASALADLGACPRRFLFRHVLKTYPPDDPEFDPERWLNALERGNLLHKVYEKALKQAEANGLDHADQAFLDLALELVDREGRKSLLETPSPSDAVRRWEMKSLRDDVRSFVEMMRGEPPTQPEVEWRFGIWDDDPEVEIAVGGHSLLVKGVVDRVDDHGSHLRVIDYKTGGGYDYSSRFGIYNKGRRFQHFLYTAAVAAEYGRPVDAMEYHFPTRRGENRIRAFDVAKLRDGGHLVATLLTGLRQGWFPATDDSRDCRYCDYQEVCGADTGTWGHTHCRFAEWTKRNFEALDELEPLRKVRTWEGR